MQIARVGSCVVTESHRQRGSGRIEGWGPRTTRLREAVSRIRHGDGRCRLVWRPDRVDMMSSFVRGEMFACRTPLACRAGDEKSLRDRREVAGSRQWC